jgi:hypothetical protein
MPRKKFYVSIAIAISGTIPLPREPTGRRWGLVIIVTKPIPALRLVINATRSTWYIPQKKKLPDLVSPVPRGAGLGPMKISQSPFRTSYCLRPYLFNGNLKQFTSFFPFAIIQ